MFVAHGIKGGTECSGPGSSAMFADRFESSSSRGAVYAIASVSHSAFNMVGLALTAVIFTQNLSDYTMVYFSLGVLVWMTAGLATIILRETLPEEDRAKWKWQQANPLSCIAIVFRSSYLKHLAAVCFLLTAGVSISTIGQAFMTTAYGLTQTEIAYVLIALVAMLTFWSMMSVPLIKHYGNRKMFTFGLISMTLASLMVVGAPYSMWCFFGALIPMSAATVASPALQTLVSKQVYAGDQAKLQAATLAISLISSAVIQPIYSALFAQVGSGAECDSTDPDTEDTIDSAANSYVYLAWLPFGLAALCGIAMFITGIRWLLVFPPSDDDVVSGAVTSPDEAGVSSRVAPEGGLSSKRGSNAAPIRIETNPDLLAMMDASNVLQPHSRRPSMYQEMRGSFQSPVENTDKDADAHTEVQVPESSPLIELNRVPLTEAN